MFRIQPILSTNQEYIQPRTKLHPLKQVYKHFYPLILITPLPDLNSALNIKSIAIP